ncbi:MAG: hypothetical protein IJZ13_01065 [Clostridia bacterium]|nr:hypothetical protein [Clostridia bacterium]
MFKRIGFVLLAIGLLLSMAGCQDRNTATGKYNGQKITMEYAGPTDIPYAIGLPYNRMVNGCVVFYQHILVDGQLQTPTGEDCWNALDRQGNLLFDVPYRDLTLFNEQGQAAAQKHSGEYVLVNMKGEETPLTEQAFRDFESQMSEQYRERYGKEIVGYESQTFRGFVYNGLAPYVEKAGEDGYLLGLATAEGHMVIPAYIPVSFIPNTYRLTMHEDTIIIDDNGYIGIVTITRS